MSVATTLPIRYSRVVLEIPTRLAVRSSTSPRICVWLGSKCSYFRTCPRGPCRSAGGPLISVFALAGGNEPLWTSHGSRLAHLQGIRGYVLLCFWMCDRRSGKETVDRDHTAHWSRPQSLGGRASNPLHAPRCGISEQTVVYKKDGLGAVGHHNPDRRGLAASPHARRSSGSSKNLTITTLGPIPSAYLPK